MNAMLAVLAAVTAAQSPPPDLVTLPLSAASTLEQPDLSAWQTVVSELDRRAKWLGVSVDLQRSQHDFLVGPAREQARDCGRDVDCLAEIGATLGADLLVVGVVSQRIALLAIRVEDRAVLAKARSPSQGSLAERARLAARRLSRRLGQATRGQRPQAERQPEAAPSAPPVVAADSNIPVPPPPAAPAKGLLYIHRDQLTGVTQLTLNGQAIAFTGEGFVSWPALSGQHTLRARHVDGRELVKTVILESGQTTEVDLTFDLPTPPPLVPRTDTQASSRQESVTDSWWFWTAVGSAVLAGAATAALLATGNKGGPNPPTETGSIQGTY